MSTKIDTRVITWFCVDRNLEELARNFFPEVQGQTAIEAIKHELLENDGLRIALIQGAERRISEYGKTA